MLYLAVQIIHYCYYELLTVSERHSLDTEHIVAVDWHALTYEKHSILSLLLQDTAGLLAVHSTKEPATMITISTL